MSNFYPDADPNPNFVKIETDVLAKWKSENTFTRGSFKNSSQFHDEGFATSPSKENRQVAKSICGAPEASSTGHFSVRDCPAGIRFPRRVSGEIIASEGACGEEMMSCP